MQTRGATRLSSDSPVPVFGCGGRLVGGIPREFQIRKAHGVDHYLIGANVRRCLKALRARICDVVVLIDAISADSEAAYEHAILIEGQTSREENNSALI